jgi:hypothetical protein
VFAEENYIREIPLLNACHNVKTLGYVSTQYGARPIEAIKGDIEAYAKWSTTSQSLALEGIFLDETPWLYQAVTAEYFAEIGRFVKSFAGLGKGLVGMADHLFCHDFPCVAMPEQILMLPSCCSTLFTGTK